MAELIVSISGIRGLVGQTLTPNVAARFAAAYGTLLGRGPRGSDGILGGLVVVGRDTRPSGPDFAAAVAQGLASTGCRVIHLGIVSTPGLSVMIGELSAAGGAMITASHNPHPYNGIKFFRSDGIDLNAQQGAQLKEIWQSGAFRSPGPDGPPPPTSDDSTHARHLQRLLAIADREGIARRKFKVVLDANHGAGAVAAPQLLAQLGCETHILGAQPDGQFEHEPEPIEENLRGLCQAVRKLGADLGLAQDPDADRLALVDEHGRCLGEEYTLALAALARLEEERGPVAANLSTSRMIDDVAARFDQQCHRTPVGELHVADRMVAERCVIGGEGNGGVIDPRVCPIRSSFVGIVHVLNLLARRGKTLSAVAAELPRYRMVKRKAEAPRAAIERLLASLAAHFPEAEVDLQDGVRLDWPQGWLHVRASNTEPIYRTIGESPDARWLERMLNKVDALATQLVK